MNNDLISRSALIKWIDDSVSQYGHTYSTDMLNMWGLFKDYLINKLPTVPNEYMRGYEAAEREYKRPQGKWVDDKCSICGKGIEDLIDSREWYRNETPNYCPFCGVRIEEAENETDN